MPTQLAKVLFLPRLSLLATTNISSFCRQTIAITIYPYSLGWQSPFLQVWVSRNVAVQVICLYWHGFVVIVNAPGSAGRPTSSCTRCSTPPSDGAPMSSAFNGGVGQSPWSARWAASRTRTWPPSNWLEVKTVTWNSPPQDWSASQSSMAWDKFRHSPCWLRVVTSH